MSDDSARERILDAGLALLAGGGRDALTTRDVAAAAGVQPPVIYRLFGDKRGLLDAVAERGMATFIAHKSALSPLADPLDDLRAGWDLTTEFGLSHPALFAIMSDPAHVSPINTTGLDILKRRVHRVALAGRLRVTEERAVQMIRASCVGTVFILLGQSHRDLGLISANREATLNAIVTGAPVLEHTGIAAPANALRAALDASSALSPGERHLLDELLERLAR